MTCSLLSLPPDQTASGRYRETSPVTYCRVGRSSAAVKAAIAKKSRHRRAARRISQPAATSCARMITATAGQPLIGCAAARCRGLASRVFLVAFQQFDRDALRAADEADADALSGDRSFRADGQ